MNHRLRPDTIIIESINPGKLGNFFRNRLGIIIFLSLSFDNDVSMISAATPCSVLGVSLHGILDVISAYFLFNQCAWSVDSPTSMIMFGENALDWCLFVCTASTPSTPKLMSSSIATNIASDAISLSITWSNLMLNRSPWYKYISLNILPFCFHLDYHGW